MTAKQRRQRISGELGAVGDGYIRGMVTVGEWRQRSDLLLRMLARVQSSGRVG